MVKKARKRKKITSIGSKKSLLPPDWDKFSFSQKELNNGEAPINVPYNEISSNELE